MVNEYAALLEPDPRKFYHYLVVLPAVDRNQVIGDQVRVGALVVYMHQQVCLHVWWL